MTANTPVRNSLAGESLLFAGRLFTRWRRAPTVPIQALLFPTFFLIKSTFLGHWGIPRPFDVRICSDYVTAQISTAKSMIYT